MDNLLRVGVISSTHGLKGEVKIFPTTDDPARFKKLKEAIIDAGREQITVHPESVKFFKQFVIVKFKEFNTIEEVERFKANDLLVTRENAVKLKKDEYFIADLIGLNVVTDQGEDFGVITDVLQTGANDVYVVNSPKYGEVLFPVIRQCVLDVNLEEKKVTVFVMPGLIDEDKL